MENYTNFVWKTIRGDTLIEDTDYSFYEGLTTFLQPNTDSVYCEMTNDYFPEFNSEPLRTIAIDISSLGYSTVSGNEFSMAVNSKTSSEKNALSDINPLVYGHSGILYVKSPQDAILNIFDINGRLISVKQVYEGNNSYPLEKPGIYIAKLKFNIHTFCSKIIIH